MLSFSITDGIKGEYFVESSGFRSTALFLYLYAISQNAHKFRGFKLRFLHMLHLNGARL